MRSQREAFARLQKNLRGTQIAKHLGLQNFQSLEAFTRSVKPSTYKDIASFVDAQFSNSQNHILFKGRTAFIGLSSGTTMANAKRILFSQDMVRSFEDFQMSLGAILEAHSDVQLGRDSRLTWGSSFETEKTLDGISCGYVSGFLATRSPKILRSLNFPSQETLKLIDMKDRLQKSAQELKGKDLRLLSGVPSYLIAFLEDLRKIWGIQNFSQVWPNLHTIIYSATAIDPFKEQLMELIGHPVQFIGCYAATEGPIGYEIPSITGSKNGIYAFHLGDFVYGFRLIKAGDQKTQKLNDERGRHETTLMLGELQVGDEVEVLISSPSGLLNYSMGDVIRIRSIKPYVTFEILGRLGQGLNLAAEKVSLKELQVSALQAAETLGQSIRHYFVHPGKGSEGKPCYEWTILVDRPDDLDRARAQEALDQALMGVNPDYRENRLESFFLDAPRVHVLSSKLQRIYFEKESHRGQLKMKTCFDSKETFMAFLKSLTPGLSEGVALS